MICTLPVASFHILGYFRTLVSVQSLMAIPKNILAYSLPIHLVNPLVLVLAGTWYVIVRPVAAAVTELSSVITTGNGQLMSRFVHI